MFNRIKYYTGVGSRETPLSVQNDMVRLAAAMAAHYTLRSGGADGADTAFEAGARAVKGPADIFLPWRGFNKNNSSLYGVSDQALALAKAVHPAWERLSQGAQKLQARNMYQVLGLDLESPSDLLVCWTADGCETEAARTSRTGGTASAIVLALRNQVPVFNLANPAARERLAAYLMSADSLDVSWLVQPVGLVQASLF